MSKIDFRWLLENYNPETLSCAVDFETYYDDEYSLKRSSYWHYTHHEKFHAYLVSVAYPGGEYVGPPEEFDWERLAGLIWCAHNSHFDKAVHDRLVELGKVPDVRPHAWINTADLAAFLSVPRNLKGAGKELLGRVFDKSVRDDMKGKRYQDLSPADKRAWEQYALVDAHGCWEIWQKFRGQWPRSEQLLSIHTQVCVERGVKVDRETVVANISVLQRAIFAAEQMIPWAGEFELTKTGKIATKNGEPKAKSPTSPKELCKWCNENGIDQPESTNVKDEAYQLWETKWGDKAPVVKAIQTWRKCNRLLKLHQEILARVRDDGRMEFSLCYFGAHTGRWSGSVGGNGRGEEKGVNMQNLSKDILHLDNNYQPVTMPKFNNDAETIDWAIDFLANGGTAINLRGLFIGDFVISDLSQIEPRVEYWLINDTDFLNLCRSGQSTYEAHARRSMGWTGGNLKKENKTMYAFAKARVLALGYGAGHGKFISMAAMYIGPEDFDLIFKKEVTPKQKDDYLNYLRAIKEPNKATNFGRLPEEEQRILVNSWLQVQDFRASNPGIKGLWDQLQLQFDLAAARKEDLRVQMPSGRDLVYFQPSALDQKAAETKGGSRLQFYGGKIAENLVQGLARDVFGEAILRLESRGIPVLWHVHDEAVCETLEDPETVAAIMSESPAWAFDLPVAAEAVSANHYLK